MLILSHFVVVLGLCPRFVSLCSFFWLFVDDMLFIEVVLWLFVVVSHLLVVIVCPCADPFGLCACAQKAHFVIRL